MKNFKKLMALVIAAVMVVGSMSISSFAAPGDLDKDPSISIGGLESGDNVKLYKVIKWTDGVGWELTDDFKNDTACQGVLARINATTAEDQPYTLTEADVNAFTTVARPLTNAGENASGATYTKDVDPGMYLALIVPTNPETIYNPIIVSADWATDNGTESMIASSENLVGDSAVAKKQTVEDIKEVDVNTQDDGGEFNFTIKTTIPTFSDVYTSKYFKVHDTLDDYLNLDATSIHVYKYDGGTEGAEMTTGFSKSTGTHNFDLDFTEYVSAQTQNAAQPIIIKYKATLNVPKSQLTNVTQLDNDSYVEFPNNPTDENGKSVLKDDTRQYTFTIDGSLFGGGGYKTGEIVKVGVDKDGNWIEEAVELSNTTWHSALEGATFGVWDDETKANTAGNTDYYTNSVFTTGTIQTGADGLMTIDGLDAGTYYIKEISAPAGYIKDPAVHSFEIIPDWGTDETVTEYFDTSDETWYTEQNGTNTRIASEYTVKTLKGYTVKVDGNTMASYSWTNTHEDIPDQITVNESSFEVKNTQGVELPSTGGMGTTLFYAIGAILVLGAGILLVSKRRMSAN